jgi:hypothetical protein
MTGFGAERRVVVELYCTVLYKTPWVEILPIDSLSCDIPVRGTVSNLFVFEQS